MIRDFFYSGRVADVILMVMAVEFAFLWWRGRARKQLAADLIFAIGPGACLVLALRAALIGAGPLWIGVALAASLPLHLADLARRRL